MGAVKDRAHAGNGLTCGNDGAKLVDFYVSVLEDESERTETRMQAAAWLADRGFGKAPDVQRQEGDDPLGLNDARERLAAKLAPVMEIVQRSADCSRAD